MSMLKVCDSIWSDAELEQFKKEVDQMVKETPQKSLPKKELIPPEVFLREAYRSGYLWEQFLKSSTPRQIALHMHIQKEKARLQYHLNLF